MHGGGWLADFGCFRRGVGPTRVRAHRPGTPRSYVRRWGLLVTPPALLARYLRAISSVLPPGSPWLAVAAGTPSSGSQGGSRQASQSSGGAVVPGAGLARALFLHAVLHGLEDAAQGVGVSVHVMDARPMGPGVAAGVAGAGYGQGGATEEFLVQLQHAAVHS